MMQEEAVDVSPELDRMAYFGIVPGEAIVPLGAITVVVIALYWLVSKIYPVSPWLVGLIWVTLLVTYWILWGKEPWKYGGKYHRSKTWSLGHVPFDPNARQRKPKVGSAKVGYGSSKRTVIPFEDELDWDCLVEFRLGKHPIGGYFLVQGNKKFRVVWVFR